jgi:hypothetical protein
MPTFTYPFEPGGPERLTVTTPAGFAGATLSVDGVVVGGFPNRRSFQAGASFPLKGGGMLSAQFKRGFFGNDLVVFYEGRPLHILGRKPPLRILSAGSLVLAIGVITLIASAVLLAGAFGGRGGPTSELAVIAAISVGLGVAYVIMGVFVRKGSFAALLVATVFYAIDLAALVFLAVTAEQVPSVFQIVIKLLILIALINGLIAFKEMRQMQRMWGQWLMQAQMAAAGKPVKLAVGGAPDVDPQPPAGVQ